MTKTIKTFLSLFALVSILAACSSNPDVEDTFLESEEEVDTSFEEEGSSDYEDPALDETESYVEEEVSVDTVFYFDFDQSILSFDARQALTVHAEVLLSSPASIRLEGHADERGSREYNMALGERRANAVRDFLVLQGVDGSLIETVSYGEERPVEVGSDEYSWEQNRRVELIQ